MLKTLKEWETETGVILRNNRKCGMLTEKQFKRRIKSEYIKCKTMKGLRYLSNCQEVQMNREDLKNYKYVQIWIKDQTEYIEAQKETINRLSSILSDMPKRKQNGI